MTKKQKLLNDFGEAVTELRALLRARAPLTESERLFIENRLMILQIEYSLWAKEMSKSTPVAGLEENPTAQR